MDDREMIEVDEVQYKADITAGALKLPESRLVADLLLRQVDAEGWKDAIVTKNVLQARNPANHERHEAHERIQESNSGCLVRVFMVQIQGETNVDNHHD